MKNPTDELPNRSAHEAETFRFWLQMQFADRCRRNPRYSLRAFANLLKMDPSSISQILAGKRIASKKVIEQVCQNLGANPKQAAQFIYEAKSKFRKISEITPLNKQSYDLLAEDAFATISDWYHFAILELIHVDGFKYDVRWCAKALNIKVSEAQMAIERLIRLNLVRLEGPHLVRTNKFITNFKPGLTSSAHKNLQRQILQMALEAIDNTEADEKDITAMTMAINIENLPRARSLIAKFRRELSSMLEDGPQSRVYQLAIQLYPISKNISSKGDLK